MFPGMRLRFRCLLALGVALLWLAPCAFAHPGAGIVVDPQGNVYFTHTGRGIGRIDPHGKLTYIYESGGGHWMCLDAAGSFAQTQPKFFKRITLPGIRPVLIFADGGSPVAVAEDGALYYVSNDERMTPGGMHLSRLSTSGEASRVAPELDKITEELGITGLANGPGGTVYVACPNAVFKVKTNGTLSTVVNPIEPQDCDVDYPDHNPNMKLPYLRGLAVDESGTVYAAGTGCHTVLKISPNGAIETILKVVRPWSPTGVAVHRGEVYVLEYTNANGGRDETWAWRVRKIGRDGNVMTLATPESKPQKP